MKSLPRLYWHATRRTSVRGVLLLGACAITIAALWYVKASLDKQLTEREVQLDRMIALAARHAPPRPAPRKVLSPAAQHQLDRQIGLLNRDWTLLSKRIAPDSRQISLLGMDVDPATGSIHVSGLADSTTIANIYARSLSQQTAVLRQVRLLQLAKGDDGIRFEISAQWND
ncbi:MAG: hypothetical protein ABT16_00450 [Rhodanobacter sp. SCN 65-17]|nr:MAG: hypothetical protein ABT16_00450 [Rhodanobacter sp. SCN 65-17]